MELAADPLAREAPRPPLIPPIPVGQNKSQQKESAKFTFVNVSSFKPGVSNVRPAGWIRPANGFYPTHEMIFQLKKKKKK